MTEQTESQEDFLQNHRGYELCTALIPADRTRQELIRLVDASEATVDRLANNEDFDAIQRVPTAGSEVLFTLDDSALTLGQQQICDVLLAVHTQSGEGKVSEPISRDNIGRSADDQEIPVTYEHADNKAGYSKFIQH